MVAEHRWEDKRKDSDASEIFCHDTVSFGLLVRMSDVAGFRKSQNLESFSNPYYSN